jgi:5-methylcytosine-specific restriction endonuclease McrA
MGGLQLKDPDRTFGEIDRTILYYRQERKCAVCEATMDWKDVEVHHVDEHSKGGMTQLDNGAAVHRACHPKGKAQTEAFAKKFMGKVTVS